MHHTNHTNRIYKVLVVDDSMIARETIKRILRLAPDFHVVGEAEDALQAREAIKSLNPDVLTLDVEMPGMDGIQFLKNLIRLRPMPVVMVSSLTQRGAQVTLEALDIGAIDFVPKPSGADGNLLELYADQLITKVRTAVTVSPEVLETKRQRLVSQYEKNKKMAATNNTPVVHTASAQDQEKYAGLLVAVGASTGGPEALKDFICELPPAFPPVIVSLHIPPGFSSSLSNRINQLAAVEVREAQHGDPIHPSTVYIAPGDYHLELGKSGYRWHINVHQSEKVNKHRPSVDVMFDSIIGTVPADKCLAILLTGMGRDGAAGLLRLRQAGMTTWAQDENSSVVWGMPGSAVSMGAAVAVKPLNDMAPAAADWALRRASIVRQNHA